MLRVLGALAVTFPVLGMRGGFYWQVWPHRVIFPMLLFLYGAWILKKELCNFWTAVGGYLICLLAILWNTETGLILTVAWAGMLISRFLSVGKIKIRRLLWLSFAQFAGMAGAVFGAYGTVNLYNILKHSPANSFEDFLIPLLSGSYMTGVLHLDMPTEPNAYMGSDHTVSDRNGSGNDRLVQWKREALLAKRIFVSSECRITGMSGVLY